MMQAVTVPVHPPIAHKGIRELGVLAKYLSSESNHTHEET